MRGCLHACVSVSASFGVVSPLLFQSPASLSANVFAPLMRMQEASTRSAYSFSRCICVCTGHVLVLVPNTSVCVCVCVCTRARACTCVRGRGCACMRACVCSFMTSLMGALPWQTTWTGQMLSALAWVQIAMASDYARLTALRTLHAAVHGVYAASPWNADDAMRAVCAAAQQQPRARSQACCRLLHWVQRNAEWEGNLHTDIAVFPAFQPEG